MRIAPLLGFALADDDDIGEKAEPSQGPSQPDRLLRGVLDRWLNHQEVEIAVRTGIAPRVRAEQDHARSCRRGPQQPAASLGDKSLIEHATTVARPKEEGHPAAEAARSEDVERANSAFRGCRVERVAR